MTIYKSSGEEIMAMIEKRKKQREAEQNDPVSKAIHTQDNNIVSLSNRRVKQIIKQKREEQAFLKEQEEKASGIDTHILPDNMLLCPNKRCVNEDRMPWYLHRGTVTENDRGIDILFSCENCSETYTLEIRDSSGHTMIQWNKSVVENI